MSDPAVPRAAVPHPAGPDPAGSGSRAQVADNGRGANGAVPAGFGIGPELLDRLLHYLHGSVDGCLGAGLSTSAKDSHPVCSAGIAEEIDPLQWKLGTGPTLRAALENESTFSSDLATDDRFPALAAAVAERTDLPETIAVVAVSGSWNDEGPIVLTVYLDHPPCPADLLAVEEIEPVLAMAAAVVEYCSEEMLRADQLVTMVEHRRIIEQAKGMVMAVRGCDATTAFRSLVVASQHFNVKLRDLAVATVEEVGGAPAEGPPQDAIGGAPPRSPDAAARGAARRMWAALREN
ncbi:hypothetical protein CFN78_27015 [Amycolatopsis antarctica]|uniref:ANTAR domain-containing protein n=2 Tax=Amycolatopsis antarctica TaxID=1854586 RepID=A0A263CVH3_9PSEU|nr:hypothetical protein CFN78_27015 [Amycolatopsis antarctica]